MLDFRKIRCATLICAKGKGSRGTGLMVTFVLYLAVRSIVAYVGCIVSRYVVSGTMNDLRLVHTSELFTRQLADGIFHRKNSTENSICFGIKKARYHRYQQN